MTVRKNQCHRCRCALPPAEPGRVRICEDCAAATVDEDERPPVFRGPKPADHSERVRRGWQIRLARLAMERAAAAGDEGG